MTTRWDDCPERTLGGVSLQVKGRKDDRQSFVLLQPCFNWNTSFVFFTLWVLCKISFGKICLPARKKKLKATNLAPYLQRPRTVAWPAQANSTKMYSRCSSSDEESISWPTGGLTSPLLPCCPWVANNLSWHLLDTSYCARHYSEFRT